MVKGAQRGHHQLAHASQSFGVSIEIGCRRDKLSPTNFTVEFLRLELTGGSIEDMSRFHELIAHIEFYSCSKMLLVFIVSKCYDLPRTHTLTGMHLRLSKLAIDGLQAIVMIDDNRLLLLVISVHHRYGAAENRSHISIVAGADTHGTICKVSQRATMQWQGILI